MPWHPPAPGELIKSQILSVHAALLPVGPRGTVVMLGGSEHNQAQGGTDTVPALPANVDRTALYDVETGVDAVKIASPTTDVFCSGHAYLGDGRLLIGGGTESWGGAHGDMAPQGHVHQHGNFGGHRACWVFNHLRQSWDRAADFNFEVGPGKGGGRWYPSILTLPSGDLVAFGGHPSRNSQGWHENDLPERYHYRANVWTWYDTVVHFDHTVYPGNWYPRVTLVPGGWVFLVSQAAGKCRFFDPATGGLVGPEITGLAEPPYVQGWDYGVLPLPFVPGDGHRARVMVVNGATAHFVELNLESGAPTPQWKRCGNRTGSAAGTARRFACPVFLPTGQVLVSGGINVLQVGQPVPDTLAVKLPEIFTPNIDWGTLTYNPPPAGQQIEDTIGTWQTLEGEEARVARNYHSVALLLPDGSVFTSGSNVDAAAGPPTSVGQLNIEIYRPAYFSNPGRPVLANAPGLLTYADETFTLAAGSAAQAASIRRVALIRCGSVTHGGDFDQRYVALAFEHQAGTANLLATLPADASVTPPGYYMLWIVNDAGLPCQVARFVRMAHVRCEVVTERDTFSQEEVQSYAPQVAAFEFAVLAVYDGFLPGELAGAPSVELRWMDTDEVVDETDVALVPSEARWLEHPPEWEEVAQRITYPFTVEIRNPALYDTIVDRRTLSVTFTLAGQSCSQTLDLKKKVNPYMRDVDPVRQNEPWLSTDVRTFRVRAEAPFFGDIMHGSGSDAPHVFLLETIDRIRAQPHLFETLPHSGDAAAVDLAPFDAGARVYNYAIAQVRYRATTTTAQRVKVFFRLCTTAATGLEYDPMGVYGHTGPGAGTVPLLGRAGSEVASIPFFLGPRVETRSGFPGAGSMAGQDLVMGYEFQDIAPTPGQEVKAWFGCWLDINDIWTPRFPLMPGSGNGPWNPMACQPIQHFFRSPHQCLVAEVYYEDDPTDLGETPGSSDNLAQRNLVFLHSDNPGGPDSHHVLHPFEVRPSALPALSQLEPHAGAELLAAVHKRRYRPDELLIRWHNLPRDSEVTLYFSDIDTAEIQRIATLFRHSPAAYQVVDTHTVRFRVANGTWMPLPGGRALNIPALLSVRLPDDVVYGQAFRVSIHQVSGQTGRVTGSFQIEIPVGKAELILDREVRTLSLMKHIATSIPTGNRWYPIFQRYLHGLSGRVNALGGDASTVHANPDGSGTPYTPPAREQPRGPCIEGWTASLVLALALLLVALMPSRRLAVVAGVGGFVLLGAVIAWWRRRCRGRMRCALIEWLTLGAVAAAAGLAVLFVAGPGTPLVGVMLLVAVLLSAFLVLAGFAAGCRDRCCDERRPGC